MSNKNFDHKNRWRNKTVAFRVSQEEWNMIGKAVSLSGLTKQDYITSKLLNRDVVVEGNPRVYKALRYELKEILTELKRIQGQDIIDKDLLETINLVTNILKGLKGE